MSKIFNMSKTQYLRLQGYLYDLNISGEACVFSDFSGHVDWLEISVANSKTGYHDVLFSKTLYVSTKWEPEESDKEIVDEIIAQIDDVVKNKVAKLAEIQKKREANEKAQYEKLKAKYETANE